VNKANSAALRKLAESLKHSLADLERSAKLGCRRAAESLNAARQLVKVVRKRADDPLLEMSDEVKKLVGEVLTAANAKDWKTAIHKQRKVLRRLGKHAPTVLCEQLSSLLAAYAVELADTALKPRNDYHAKIKSMVDRIVESALRRKDPNGMNSENIPLTRRRRLKTMM